MTTVAKTPANPSKTEMDKHDFSLDFGCPICGASGVFYLAPAGVGEQFSYDLVSTRADQTEQVTRYWIGTNV
ncbi:MAG: hypothetical protein ACLPH3_25015 [Terracidiphilus sp.]